jgi:predicted Kef-type K+ transport protein
MPEPCEVTELKASFSALLRETGFNPSSHKYSLADTPRPIRYPLLMALPLDSTGFSDALVILGAAGLVIPAFARARITPVIGFILVGILVGPHGLGAMVPQFPWLYHVSITEPDAIGPFAELGIILLLFSIGLELSFRRLWTMRQRVIGFGAAELLVSGLLIAIALILFGRPVESAFGLGIALALSSTALVLPIAGTTSAVGRLAFAMLLFEDLALVPIIFVLGAIGGSGDVTSLIGIVALGIATVVAMLVVGWFALRTGGPDQKPRAVSRCQPARRHSCQRRDNGCWPFAHRRRARRRTADCRN